MGASTAGHRLGFQGIRVFDGVADRPAVDVPFEGDRVAGVAASPVRDDPRREAWVADRNSREDANPLADVGKNLPVTGEKGAIVTYSL